jgi:hypothetical protein
MHDLARGGAFAGAGRRPSGRARLGAWRCALAACGVACAVAVGPSAAAEPAGDARKEAAALFADGERAFAAGDFLHAGEAFEAAYRTAPHHAALWNAARAWQRAGERARSANLYVRYLREAPPDAPDRNGATAALRELGERLGRIEIFAPAATDVTIDDHPADAAGPYVNPGTHVVRGRIGERVVQRAPVVDAGAVVSVALIVEEPKPAATAAPAAAPTAPATALRPTVERATTAPGAGDARRAPPERAGTRWGPPLVIAGGALTAISGGVLLWSGIDTLNAKSAFDRLPAGTHTQGVIDDGRAKQDRTNVLVGVTAGLSVLTAAGAIWLLEWGPHRASAGAAPRAQLGANGRGAVVGGSF